jgi:deoxyribonuclease-4
MDALVAELAAKVGLERVGSLHLNDSQAPLGSNRDRHANVGQGELGERGCAAFLGTPALQQLPCVLETPGEKHGGAKREEVELAMRLHARGVAARRRAARRARPATSSSGSGSRRERR